VTEDDIVYRLQKRACIRRQIPNRKSVQEGKPDRIAELLEEAAATIIQLRGYWTRGNSSKIIGLFPLSF